MRAWRVELTPELRGVVKLQGAKNSVLKLMAATLLAEGRHRLENVPMISDVVAMGELLSSVGATVSWPAPHVVEIDVPPARMLSSEPEPVLVGKIRASVVLLAPLLARVGRVRLAAPGGDDFGSRPIDVHLDALVRLGATVAMDDDAVVVKGGPLRGAPLTLEFPSHTGTDTAVLAAVLAAGETIIDNAAKEPEVVDLCAALSSMGARIEGAGTSRIRILGVAGLAPMRHRVIGDRVVAATLLAALGMTGGEVSLTGIDPTILELLLRKLVGLGFEVDVDRVQQRVVARVSRRLHAGDIQTLPYPGVATDYKPMLVAMLTRAQGVSVVSENLYMGRFRYLDELRSFGADIISEGHHVVVRGVDRLHAATVVAHDIRAGAALVVAALGAHGTSHLLGVEHIERGYDNLAGELQRLGARVWVEGQP